MVLNVSNIKHRIIFVHQYYFETAVGFRIYLGTRSEMSDDDYIRFDVLDHYQVDPFVSTSTLSTMVSVV